MGVKVDCREMKMFAEKVKKLNEKQREQFLEQATRTMASSLLSLVIPATPVGSSAGEHQGGTLRRGWTGGESEVSFSGKLNVQHVGRGYTITITNPVEYASYVEYGHRQTPGRYVPAIGKQLKAKWVNGKFFLRSSEKQLRAAAPAILQPMLDAYLRQVF